MLEYFYQSLAWFQTLNFGIQILIVSAIMIPVTFIEMMLLEFGPFASASPLSGGLGIIAVIIGDLLLAIVSLILGPHWMPLYFLATPFLSCIWLAIIIFIIGSAWIALMNTFARRAGLTHD